MSHRYSINIPDNVFKAIKVKALLQNTTMKDIILSSVKLTVKDIIKQDDETLNKLLYSSATKSFAEEWLSDDDEQAFENLQKYSKNFTH